MTALKVLGGDNKKSTEDLICDYSFLYSKACNKGENNR